MAALDFGAFQVGDVSPNDADIGLLLGAGLGRPLFIDGINVKLNPVSFSLLVFQGITG